MTNRARMYLRYRDLSWAGPTRNLIRASSLRSRGIPSNSTPNPPLQGSLPWCSVLCGRDARAPGWVPPATLFVQAACDPGAFLRTEHQTGLCRVRYYGAQSYAGETPALPGGRSPIHSCSSRERVGLPGRSPAVQIMRESLLQYWQWDRSFCRQSRCSAYFNSRVRPGEKGEFTTKSTKVTKRIS